MGLVGDYDQVFRVDQPLRERAGVLLEFPCLAARRFVSRRDVLAAFLRREKLLHIENVQRGRTFAH